MSRPGAGLDVAVPRGQCQPRSSQVSQEQRSALGRAEPKCLRSCSASRCPHTEPGPACPTPCPSHSGGDICACCCDTGGIWSPPHPSLGAGQMLLLDSWTLLQGWGVPRDLAWQEMELGLWQGPNPRPRGLFCLPGSPSPALPGDLPLLTITHTQPRLAGSAWHGDTSGPSPCLWTSHSGCPHSLSDPVWGQTSLLLWGGHCGPPAPSFHCKGLPQLCGHCPHYPGTHGGNFS